MSFVLEIASLFALSILIGSLASLALASGLGAQRPKGSLPMLVALAVIGACAGLSGGLSLAPAVGDIIPAFLGFLGAVAIYLFGVEMSRGISASIGAVALSVSLFLGYGMGANYRHTTSSDHTDLRQHCVQAYTNADLLKDDTAFARFDEVLGPMCALAMGWSINLPNEYCEADDPSCPRECVARLHSSPVIEAFRKALFCPLRRDAAPMADMEPE